MNLAGKTLFMSGGSRGIGLAIALGAARDGANVVIAAKTADSGLAWAMDSLNAMAGTGILDGDTFIEQMFASKEDVRSFRLTLRDTGADKWLTDRHFTALKKLSCAELDAVTYASIASFFDPAE